jgi:flagellar biosynthesis protein FlhG
MPEIYPIGGGKGGVGKSFIVASLGAIIAKQGQRVLLIDLDLGASNLHTYLGIKNPKCGIDSYLAGKINMLEQVAVPTAIPNLYFISSLYCLIEIANLFYTQKQKLISAIRKLPFDYIFLDLGPGTNYNTLDFFLTSNNGILILTHELPSIENSFRFIKAVYLRKLKQIIKQHAFNSAVKNAAADQNNAIINSEDIIKIVLRYDPEKEEFLKEKLSELKFKFIINRSRKNLDPKLGDKITTICNRHFYSNFQFLGNISYNERINVSVLSRKLFVLEYPRATSSIDLKKIGDKISKVRNSDLVTSQIP